MRSSQELALVSRAHTDPHQTILDEIRFQCVALGVFVKDVYAREIKDFLLQEQWIGLESEYVDAIPFSSGGETASYNEVKIRLFFRSLSFWVALLGAKEKEVLYFKSLLHLALRRSKCP